MRTRLALMVIAVSCVLIAGALLEAGPGCRVDRFLAPLASAVELMGWIQLDDGPGVQPASAAQGPPAAAQGLRWGGYGPAGLVVHIDAESRFLQLYMGSEQLHSWRVAVGKPSTPTPLGTWLVTDKAVWGGAFGARWNGLSVPWGRYGVHGTNRPGSVGGNLSAGCVRMLNQDVIQLYRYIPVGTPVVITGREQEHFGGVPRPVRFASRGSDVMQLQRILLAENLYWGSVDGIFGAGTLSALRAYQQMTGQTGTGDLDLSTWEDLGLGVPAAGSIWFR